MREVELRELLEKLGIEKGSYEWWEALKSFGVGISKKYGYTAVPCGIDREARQMVDWTWDGRIFDTLEECEDWISEWGSRWAMFPDVRIYKIEKGRRIFSPKHRRPLEEFLSE